MKIQNTIKMPFSRLFRLLLGLDQMVFIIIIIIINPAKEKSAVDLDLVKYEVVLEATIVVVMGYTPVEYICS